MQVQFEGETFDFDMEDLDLAEARFVKRQIGVSVGKFIEGLREIDPDCAAALYVIMKKRNGTALDINKVNFPVIRFAQAVSEAMDKEETEKENPTQPEASEPATT